MENERNIANEKNVKQNEEEHENIGSGSNVYDQLTAYITSIRSRKDEDGITPAFEFPENFDNVVSLMSYKDLCKDEIDGVEGNKDVIYKDIDSTEQPWSKCLLMESMEKTGTFSQYQYLFREEQTMEKKCNQGLAKIRELDLTLAKKNSEAELLEAEIDSFEIKHADTGATEGSKHRWNGPNGNSTSDISKVFDNCSDSDSMHSSSHGNGCCLINSKPHSSDMDSSDQAFLTQRSYHGNESKGMYSKNTKSVSSSSTRNRLLSNSSHGHKIKPHQLTQEQEERVRKLLCSGNEVEIIDIWQDIERYGPSQLELNRLAEIDTKLSQFRDKDETNHIDSSSIHSTQLKYTGKNVDANIGSSMLQQERDARLLKERMCAIDESLKLLKASEPKLSSQSNIIQVPLSEIGQLNLSPPQLMQNLPDNFTSESSCNKLDRIKHIRLQVTNEIYVNTSTSREEKSAGFQTLRNITSNKHASAECISLIETRNTKASELPDSLKTLFTFSSLPAISKTSV